MCFVIFLFFFELNKTNFVRLKKGLFNWVALALMETASFCAGVRRKRYSVQQETAP